MKNSTWYVYIIETNSGKLYTGITTDVDRRFSEHKNKKGAKYFRTEIPKKVVFIETYKSRPSASKREI